MEVSCRTLLELPRDCMLVFLSFLRPSQLANIGRTCTTMYCYSHDEWLWREYCQRHGYQVRNGLPAGFHSWRQFYIAGGFMVLREWQWDDKTADSSLNVGASGDIVQRLSTTGHNPSVIGSHPCPVDNSSYFEVEITRCGKWISLGFASQEFALGQERNHTGKAHGTVAYYSDSSIHKIFHPHTSCQNMPPLKDGDVVGILVDPTRGSSDFFVNGVHHAHVHYDAHRWFKGQQQEGGDQPGSPGGKVERPILRPALSLGQEASCRVLHPGRVPPAAMKLLR
jgi:hypothetical protein